VCCAEGWSRPHPLMHHVCCGEGWSRPPTPTTTPHNPWVVEDHKKRFPSYSWPNPALLHEWLYGSSDLSRSALCYCQPCCSLPVRCSLLLRCCCVLFDSSSLSRTAERPSNFRVVLDCCRCTVNAPCVLCRRLVATPPPTCNAPNPDLLVPTYQNPACLLAEIHCGISSQHWAL
jgi:hypothetical protein